MRSLRHAARAALSFLAAATLALAAAPAGAATLLKANFGYDLYLADGSTSRLSISAVFDAADALLLDDGSWVMFDGGEAAGLLKSFTFSGAGMTEADLAAYSDVFRMAFFDVSAGAGTVFEPQGDLFVYTAFENFGTDAAGCAVGLSSQFFGLGADRDGVCQVASYEASRPASFSLERLGSGEPTGVPEPATWAMLIAGFGLAGAALRQRRALAAAAA